ncbi:MAG: hypothetical protein JXR40_05340 [Pontiellaceae bacterium]|nr:hypothetical protein [Pontiellaceae bacterium]
MKYFIGICSLAVFSGALASVYGETGFHTFTDRKGRTIEALIKQVDLEGRRVQVERNDNAVAWVDVDLLRKSDLSYITKWYNARQLLRDDALRISVAQESGRSRTSKLEDDIWVRKTPHKATLTLKNLNDAVIEKMQIDYCFYIAPSETAPESQVRRVTGTIDVGTLVAKKDQTADTAEVVLNTEFTVMDDTSAFGSSTKELLKSEERIIGVRFRIFGAGEDGVYAVRELSVPEDLPEKLKWKYATAEEKDADRS